MAQCWNSACRLLRRGWSFRNLNLLSVWKSYEGKSIIPYPLRLGMLLEFWKHETLGWLMHVLECLVRFVATHCRRLHYVLFSLAQSLPFDFGPVFSHVCSMFPFFIGTIEPPHYDRYVTPRSLLLVPEEEDAETRMDMEPFNFKAMDRPGLDPECPRC